MYKEEFSSIFELMNTLKERPNNKFMRNEHSSQNTSNWGWSGTKTYEEAESLLIYGYSDPVKNIKSNLIKNKKLVSKMYNLIPKPIATNQVVGFVPNVPNALMGLPKSMISVEKINRKKKTISIIYATGVTLIEAVNPNISDATYEEFWSNIFRDTSDNGPVDWGAYYDKMRGE